MHLTNNSQKGIENRCKQKIAQPQKGTDTNTETENTTAYSIHTQMTVKIHNKTETRSGRSLSSEEADTK